MPYHAERMTAKTESVAVNKVKNSDPGVVERRT
jgi:hypothetical protein